MKTQDELKDLEDLGFLPERMAAKLLPFQREGVKFAIGKQGRVLIGDEMGLGKTLQALATAYYYKDEWPLLIVVPSSLRYPWIEEVEKWMPEINPTKIKLVSSGTDIHDIGQADLCVVTYGLLRHPSCKVVQEALNNQKFNIIIVDESHYIKNRKAATTKFLVPLLKNAKRKLLLTGTPALARPEELYPQLEALGHSDIFGNWAEYSKKYCNAHAEFFGRTRRWDTSGASNLSELQSNLREHVMIRRLKRDVLTQLPPKQRQKVPFEVKDSKIKKEMDELWRELHGILGKGETTINHVFDGALGTEEDSRFRIRCLMGELYRMTAKVKIGPVKEYMKMLCQNAGLKIIVFAHHHIMMDGIQEQLNDDKIKFIRIDGKTSQQERPSLVHQYQSDPEIRVAILSMKAAGVGLTLTAAKLVVFAELDWTPGVLEQCEDRAHRIGQKETVHVHYLVGRWTLDDWVWTALCKKTVVVTTTLNGEKQLLQMDSANPGQISWLERADAWAPPPVVSDDALQDVFQQSQTPSNQKSVLDYFKPKSAGGGSPALEESKKMKSRKRKKSAEDHVIELLESGSDEETFRTKEKHLHSETVDMDSSHDSLPDIRSKPRKRLKEQKTCKKVTQEREEDKEQSQSSLSSSEVITPSRLSAIKKEASGGEGSKQLGVNVCSQWNCQACTFLNIDMLPYCEMCSSPKPQPTRKNGARSCKSQKDKDDGLSGDEKVSNPETAESLGSVEKIPKFSQYVKRLTARVDKVTQVEGGNTNQNGKSVDSCDEKTGGSASCDSRKKHQRTASTSQNIETSDSVKKTKCKSSFQPRKIILTAENKPVRTLISSHHFVKKKRGYSNVALSFMSAESGSSDEEENVLPLKFNNDIEEDLAWAMDTKEDETSVKSDDAPVIDSYESDFDAEEQDVTIGDISCDEMDVPCNGADLCDNTEEYSDGDNYKSDVATSQHSQGSCNTVTTPNSVTKADLQAEQAAASALFSPKRVTRVDLLELTCPNCEFVNKPGADDCDGCLESRPVQEISGVTDRQVDLDKVPVYTLFKFRCSLNTARVYLYDEDGNSLDVNFLPFDVEMDNFAELPDILLHPNNLAIAKRFVRVWNSISPTKQNIIVRSRQIFANPILLYDQIKGGKKLSSERYTSKMAGAMAAFVAAENTGGTIRVIARPEIPSKKSSKKRGKDDKDGKTSSEPTGDADEDVIVVEGGSGTSRSGKGQRKKQESQTLLSFASSSKEDDEEPWQDIDKMKGIVQAMDADGQPLCVYCQKPYSNDLLSKETLEKNPWITRFCSSSCTEQYWISRHRDYGKQKLFSLEKGVCQLCNFDAQEFFRRIKTIKDLKKRASLIQDSKYSVLSAKVKESMARNPLNGQFWQMDHIVPVVDGGGECDIDNLRTLCSVCHQEITKEQNKDRRAYRKHVKNAKLGDITAFLHKSN